MSPAERVHVSIEVPGRPRARTTRHAWLPMEALMTAVAEGDERSFGPLFQLLHGHIRRFLLSMMRDEHAVEDLTQKTFVKLWRARGQYALGSPLKPWVLAIARRTMLDEMRRRRRSRDHLTDDGVLPDATEHEAPGAGASEIDIRYREALVVGLTRLTEIQSEAIRLVSVEDLSLLEAASAAGASVTAMKVRVHRAYNVIRKSYEGRPPSRMGGDDATGVLAPPRARAPRRRPTRCSCKPD